MEFYARAGLYDHGPGKTKYHYPSERKSGRYFSICHMGVLLNPNSTLFTSNLDSPRLCHHCARLLK